MRSRSEMFGKAWTTLFPKGYPAITVSKIIEPGRDLEKESKLTVEDVILSQEGKRTEHVAWVTCRDSEGNLWNIRPKQLRVLETDPQKKGRYSILRQNIK